MKRPSSCSIILLGPTEKQGCDRSEAWLYITPIYVVIIQLIRYLCAKTWDNTSLENMETSYNEAHRLQKEHQCHLKHENGTKARETKASMINSLYVCSLNRQKCVISKKKLTSESCLNDP